MCMRAKKAWVVPEAQATVKMAPSGDHPTEVHLSKPLGG